MAGFPELPFPPYFEAAVCREAVSKWLPEVGRAGRAAQLAALRDHQETVNVKMRWRGRPLQEVMQEEFGYDHQYVASAVSSENLLLNGRRCAVDELLENGDVLKHSFVMQEPTVSDEPILKLAENEHVLVVQKPAGLPCHPRRGSTSAAP
ncbi:unnamed protein product [Effrenium voratum]|nr:unnamed protein product [Effrenium voratum]